MALSCLLIVKVSSCLEKGEATCFCKEILSVKNNNETIAIVVGLGLWPASALRKTDDDIAPGGAHVRFHHLQTTSTWMAFGV